jgi:hypothetical protein
MIHEGEFHIGGYQNLKQKMLHENQLGTKPNLPVIRIKKCKTKFSVPDTMNLGLSSNALLIRKHEPSLRCTLAPTYTRRGER